MKIYQTKTKILKFFSHSATNHPLVTVLLRFAANFYRTRHDLRPCHAALSSSSTFISPYVTILRVFRRPYTLHSGRGGREGEVAQCTAQPSSAPAKNFQVQSRARTPGRPTSFAGQKARAFRLLTNERPSPSSARPSGQTYIRSLTARRRAFFVYAVADALPFYG